VVREIVSAGGKAAPNYSSVVNGDEIIRDAVQIFGRLDILINNAGILRDVSFKNMTDKQWDDIDAVHIKGESDSAFGKSCMTTSASITPSTRCI
jgi:multifunctional beta-oxidation protein